MHAQHYKQKKKGYKINYIVHKIKINLQNDNIKGGLISWEVIVENSFILKSSLKMNDIKQLNGYWYSKIINYNAICIWRFFRDCKYGYGFQSIRQSFVIFRISY